MIRTAPREARRPDAIQPQTDASTHTSRVVASSSLTGRSENHSCGDLTIVSPTNFGRTKKQKKEIVLKRTYLARGVKFNDVLKLKGLLKL